MFNYEFINKKARDSQIDEVTIEREYWQLLYLQKLYAGKGSEKILFKGGTAIRFLFGSFRFSEDLDFTATLSSARLEDLLIKSFRYLEQNFAAELEFKKEPVRDTSVDVSVRYRFLFLPAKIKHKTSIRLDISLREKPVTREQSVLIPFDYPISPYPLVMHFSAEEIMAEKIRALFVRSKPRDLFDFWFLLTKKVAIKPDLINKKFQLYPQLKFTRASLAEKIRAYRPQELKQDLNRLLPQNYRLFYQNLPRETLELL